MIQTVALDALHVSPAYQPRAELCEKTVKEYVEAMAAGAVFPRLVAFNVSDKRHKGPALVAGFHTHAAYKARGATECEVEVLDGTYAEAWLYAFRSNQQHGLRYTNADKRHAAEKALVMFTGDSNRVIAERLGLSHDFLSRVRKELEVTGKIEKVETTTGKDGRGRASAPETKTVEREQLSSDDSWQSAPDQQTVPQPEPEPSPNPLAPPEPEVAGSVGLAITEPLEPENEEAVAAFFAEGDAEAEEEPEPDTGKPQPSRSRKAGQFPLRNDDGTVKPAIDPDHPHAKLLRAIVTLAGCISAAVNDADQDSFLRLYLLHIGYVFPRAKIIGDRKYGWQCVGLRGLYRAVKLAGLDDKPKTKERMLKLYQAAMNPDGDA